MTQLQVGRYRQVFQSRSFRLFWPGITLSMLGDALTRVALTWYVFEVTHSPRALGLFTLVNLGPVAIGGLLAGVLLDRFGRRRVMLIDSLVRGVAVASVPLAYALGSLALWHVYAVAGLYGMLMMIVAAGGPSLVPSLIHEEHLSTANALEYLGFTLSNVIGPPVAGLLIGVIGAPNVLILDAATYFLFALALTGVRPLPGRNQPDTPPPDASAEGGHGIGDALRLLTGNAVLLSTTLMYMIGNLGLGMIFVWLPVLVGEGEGGSQLYGQRAWLVALSLGLYGLISAPLTIWAQTLRMQIIPEPLRGRTFALLRTLMIGALPAGGALAGLLIPVIGIPVVMALSAAAHIAPGMAGYQVRELRMAGPPPA